MNDLAYIYNPKASFERQDLSILQGHFDVVPIEKPMTRLEWLSYYSDLREIRDCRVVLAWFAGWPAYLASLTARVRKKPFAVITGGYDVAQVPEIGYGATLNYKERWSTIKVLQNADLCIPVSHANERDLLERCIPRSHRMIYNAVDSDVYHPDGMKDDTILTVGGVTRGNYRKKGLKTFIEVAERIPEYQFQLVGGGDPVLIKEITVNAPDNLILTGHIEHDALIKRYQSASVYIQASAHESFGVAVVEAMLCGCIPVVSDRGALPEVSGFPRWIYSYGDLDDLTEKIRDAMNVGGRWRDMARNRGKFFSLDRRENELVDALEAIM